MNDDLGRAYVDLCRFRVSKHYWPRIEKCVSVLSEDEIWWRKHETNNSVGNLILHLTGNLKQFVLSGIGGAPDGRNKDQEFSERVRLPKAELMKDLESALRQADEVLNTYDVTHLQNIATLQGRERSHLEIIAVVVDHFALHTGQVIYITKLITGRDLNL